MLMLSLANYAQLTITDDNFYYHEGYFPDFSFGSGMFVSAKDKNSLSGDIEIPAYVTYQGKKYTVIGVDYEGFASTKITSVVIPNTVLEIGVNAFRDCPNLKKVVLSSRIYRLRGAIFIGSSNLKEIVSRMYYPSPIVEDQWMKEYGINATIYVPKGSLAFYQSEKDWQKLGTIIERDDIEIDNKTLSYEVINEHSVRVHPYSWNIRGEVKIPSQVNIDGHDYTVTWMEHFRCCRRLEKINIPETIEYLSSLNNCDMLQELNIPRNAGFTSWYEPMTYGCNQLKRITVEEGNSTLMATGDALFSKDGTVMCGYAGGIDKTEYEVPEGVSELVPNLFAQNDKLKKITLPSTVHGIPYNCFGETKALKNLEIKGPVTTIGERAFYETSIEDFVLPTTVNKIENMAFCSGSLKTFTSKVYKAIDIPTGAFYTDTYEKCVLYVPTGRSFYYKNAINWKKFIHIEEREMADVIISKNPFDNVGENQMVMGYYTAESLEDYTFWDRTPGFYAYYYPVEYAPAGQYKMCIGYKKDDLSIYEGNSITHMRFALGNTRGLSGIKFWIGSSRDKKDLYVQSVNSVQEGWNIVTLEKPYEINAGMDSIFIGIDYQQDSWNAPIPLRDVFPQTYIEGAGYMYGNYKGTQGMWVDVAKSVNATIPLQCIIEGNNIPKYALRFVGSSTNRFFKPGEEVLGEVVIQNRGKLAPGADFVISSILVDGRNIGDSRMAEGSSVGVELSGIPFGMPIHAVLPSDIAVGEHTLKVVFSSIMGVKPGINEGDTINVPIKIYNNPMVRQKSLVEIHQTFSCNNTASTDQGALKEIGDGSHYILLNEHHDDALACPASQAYLVKDTITGTRNFFSTNRYDNGYIYREYSTIPSFADIHISSSYDNKSRILYIKVKGTRSKDFVLVEKWANLTVLLSEDKVVLPIYNDLTEEWDLNYEHNALLRTNVSAIWGDPIEWNDDQYEMNYQIKLKDGWVKDNMHIVAFISRPFTGSNFDDLYLINCNIFDVKESEIIQSIEPVNESLDLNFVNLLNSDSALSNTVIDNTYYNMDAANGDGYSSMEQALVLNSTTTSTQMHTVQCAQVGDAAVKDNFSGVIFEIPAGQGTITVDAKTIGSHVLNVQVGNGAPTKVTKSERGTVDLTYDVAAATYVYLYASTADGSAAPIHRAATVSANSVLLYGYKVTIGSGTGINAVTIDKPVDVYTLQGQKVRSGVTSLSGLTKGVYIINGRKVVVK